MIGLSHIQREFVVIKVPITRIEEHQKLFPDLEDKMKGLDAVKKYQAFLMMLPYQVKGELTEEIKIKILEEVKLI